MIQQPLERRSAVPIFSNLNAATTPAAAVWFPSSAPPPPEVLTKLKVARAPRTRPARARPVVRIALERPARHSGARLGRCQIERAGVFIGYSVVVLRLGAVDRK